MSPMKRDGFVSLTLKTILCCEIMDKMMMKIYTVLFPYLICEFARVFFCHFRLLNMHQLNPIKLIAELFLHFIDLNSILVNENMFLPIEFGKWNYFDIKHIILRKYNVNLN